MVRNWKKMASVAYGCALTRLALNMYLYFGEMAEDDEQEAGISQELDRRYMELLSWYLDGEDTRVLEEIYDFREKIRQEMESAAAYSDAFEIYEYALNRVERRFVDGLPEVDTEPSVLVSNVMRYLATAEEVTVQNQRIHEIIRQLPVRFTRQKYFSMVHDALTSYIGGDYEGLEEILYLLRCGSLIEVSQRRRESYKSLNQLLDQLAALSFKDLTKESYQKNMEHVKEAGEMLAALLEYYTSLQEQVNDLYILCLTGRDAVGDAASRESALSILRGLREQYEKGSREIPEEISRQLPRLEGLQEEYDEKYRQLSFRQESSGQEDETERKAARLDKLMSASTFADLEGEKRQGSVTREDLEKETAAFFAELEPVLSSCQKPVARAIMATTLSYLPVQFHSSDELQNHIRNSLECCTDSAERATCMELLLMMMEMDGYEMV